MMHVAYPETREVVIVFEYRGYDLSISTLNPPARFPDGMVYVTSDNTQLCRFEPSAEGLRRAMGWIDRILER